MDESRPVAGWLSHGSVGLRAPVLSDLGVRDRWWIGEVPADRAEAERSLRNRERIPWGGNPVLTFVIALLEGGEIVGGLTLTRSAGRNGLLEIRVPEDDSGRRKTLADTLAAVVPWAVGELGLMTVVLQTPEDDSAVVDAALASGMIEAVRRREHVVRGDERVDLLQFERVNTEWGRYAG